MHIYERYPKHVVASGESTEITEKYINTFMFADILSTDASIKDRLQNNHISAE